MTDEKSEEAVICPHCKRPKLQRLHTLADWNSSNCLRSPEYCKQVTPYEEQLALQARTIRELTIDRDERMARNIEQGDRLAALSRIVSRALACHQLEKLEDAMPYLDSELDREGTEKP